MKKEGQNIEGLFTNAFAEHTVVPEAKVLKSLRFKLWKTDFFSLNFRKFNVVYASLIIGGTVAFALNANNKADQTTTPNINKQAQVEPKQPVENFGIAEKPKVETTIVEETGTPIKEESKPLIAVAMFEPSAKEGCAPLTIKFTDRSEHASSHTWDFGDGESSRSKAPVHEYDKPGTYVATLTILDANNKTLSYDVPIRVHGKPVSDFSIDKEKSDMETRNIVFENNSANANNFIWDFGDNTPPVSSKQANHIYSSYNTYPVKLIAISEHGCSDTLLVTNKFIDKNYTLSFPLSFIPSRTGAATKGYYGSAATERSIFYPTNNGVQEYTLAVYAPNGTKVFETNDIKQGWNGFYKGRMMPGGMYRYMASGVYPNGKKFAVKSQVKVIVENFHDNY